MLQQRLEAWGVPYVFSRPDALARTLHKGGLLRHARPAAGYPGARPPHGHPGRWAADRAGVLAELVGPWLRRCRCPSGPAGRLVAVKPLTGGSSFGVDVVPADRGGAGRRGRCRLRLDRRCRHRRGVPQRDRVLGGGARRPGRGARRARPHRGGEAPGQPGLRHRGEVPARLRGHPPHPHAGGRRRRCTPSGARRPRPTACSACATWPGSTASGPTTARWWSSTSTASAAWASRASSSSRRPWSGIDHRHLIIGLLRAATRAAGRDGRRRRWPTAGRGPADPRGARRADERAPGQPPERVLRRPVPAGHRAATSASS